MAVAETLSDAGVAPRNQIVRETIDGQERFLFEVDQGLNPAVLLAVFDSKDPAHRIVWSASDLAIAQPATLAEVYSSDWTWLFGKVDNVSIRTLRIDGIDGTRDLLDVSAPGFVHRLAGEINVQRWSFLDGTGRVVAGSNP